MKRSEFPSGRWIVPVVVAALWGAQAALAAPASQPASQPAAAGAWPQFHGPSRDNISPDKGLLKQWPAGGPKLLWTAGLGGGGYSTVTIGEGLLFTSGDFKDRQRILALDADGKIVWQADNGLPWKGEYPGSRSVPTYCDGVVYHLNSTGRLAAFQARGGKEIWAVDLKAEYAAQWGQWAMAENVIVDGNAVLVAPGGRKGRIVALDKATGKCLWANTEIPDVAEYSSPIIVTCDGVRQAVTVMQKSIVSVDVRTGKLLWTYPHPTAHDQNVNMVIHRDGVIYASSGHGTGARALKLAPGGAGVTQLWLSKDLDNCHGGVLLVDGCLYGSGCRMSEQRFLCVSVADGKTLWTDKSTPRLSLTYADGLAYGLGDNGRMYLVDLGPKQFRVVSQFEPPKGTGPWLAHPVVVGGRMYLRHGADLFCYDVRAAAGAAAK
jgi:outer membrane protein assembly factor BamB